MKSEKTPLAINITKRRKKLGWNQESLAERIGVHVNTIKNIERGLSEGTPDTRANIAKALGCEPWQLGIPEELLPETVNLIKTASKLSTAERKVQAEYVLNELSKDEHLVKIQAQATSIEDVARIIHDEIKANIEREHQKSEQDKAELERLRAFEQSIIEQIGTEGLEALQAALTLKKTLRLKAALGLSAESSKPDTSFFQQPAPPSPDQGSSANANTSHSSPAKKPTG